jgi:hypothetical protein
VINRDRHDLAGLSQVNLLLLVIVSLVLFRSAPTQTPTRVLPPSSELLETCVATNSPLRNARSA